MYHDGGAKNARNPSTSLNVLHGLLTFRLLGIGGTERNPFLSLLQVHVGGVFMLLAKLALAGVAGLAIYKMGKASLFLLASQLMTLVVVYNLA